jgi:hypothetical protein
MSMSENEYRKLTERWKCRMTSFSSIFARSAISALAEQSVDLIERQMVRIAELEREVAYVDRKADPLNPMARFRNDAHPAVTSARIAVHNAKIMGRFGPKASDYEG